MRFDPFFFNLVIKIIHLSLKILTHGKNKKVLWNQKIVILIQKKIIWFNRIGLFHTNCYYERYQNADINFAIAVI